MIEFVISKLWTVICGVLVIGVILSCFSSLDLSLSNGLIARSGYQLTDAIEEGSQMEEGSSLRLPLEELLPNGEAELIIQGDHLRVRLGESEVYMPLDDVRIFGSLPITCHNDDVVLLLSLGEGNLLVELEGTPITDL
jgi:hypothetical protein